MGQPLPGVGLTNDYLSPIKYDKVEIAPEKLSILVFPRSGSLAEGLAVLD